jgi:ring-1,2-phenylacetyl-CoA epoxidase subunit PaaE
MSKVTVTLDGATVSFDLETTGNTVLVGALDAGLDAPYSCQGGVCTTCKCKILSGTATMDSNYALTPKEVEKGYLLACQAHPTSDELIISWDEA